MGDLNPSKAPVIHTLLNFDWPMVTTIKPGQLMCGLLLFTLAGHIGDKSGQYLMNDGKTQNTANYMWEAVDQPSP